MQLAERQVIANLIISRMFPFQIRFSHLVTRQQSATKYTPTYLSKHKSFCSLLQTLLWSYSFSFKHVLFISIFDFGLRFPCLLERPFSCFPNFPHSSSFLSPLNSLLPSPGSHHALMYLWHFKCIGGTSQLTNVFTCSVPFDAHHSMVRW